MNKSIGLFLILFLILPIFASAGENDGWKLRKNDDGIKVYTKEKEETHIYMYKVIAKISVKPEVVYRQVVDFRENLKYMELVDSLRPMKREEDRRYRNYMHFNMPWPVKNREMVMEMLVTKDQYGIYLESTDLPELLSKTRSAIRIEDFQEKWTIKKGANPNESEITVKGYMNPGGALPAWVVNLFSANTPFRLISGILREVRKDQ